MTLDDQELKSKCHSFVTDLCHTYGIRLTPRKLQFLKKAYSINAVKRNYFTFDDFYPMKKDNFRQMIHRLRPVIVTEINSNPGFYRLQGIEVNSNVTMRDRGVSQIPPVDHDFHELLASCQEQPVTMHDLRINTRTEYLYENLLKRGFTPNEYNKQITIKLHLNRHFPITLNIFKSGRLQIIIACTYEPLPYSPAGFNQLAFILGRAMEDLALVHAGSDFVYPPIGDWIVDYYHLNKDGLEIDAKKYNYTITQLSNHAVFYIKEFEDKTIRPRYEEHKSPHKPISILTQESACQPDPLAVNNVLETTRSNLLGYQ